jgi:hypothetical protein
MADNKVITLDVQSNIDESAKSVGSLKAQLREAQAEVAALSDKFGATSKEAVEAAKRAGELKDRIGDAKALTDAFNPDAKFKAVSASLAGVAGGFSAVTGAMGVLGVESESVEKQILKVQSAMAIASGLQQLGESADAFKQMKAVAIDAFKGIKAAIGSTGIGLFVVALGAIYTYWDDIKAAVSGVSEEQKSLNAISQKNVDQANEKLKAIGSQDNILKLQGKSEKDILAIKIKQTDEAIAATKINIENQIQTNKLAEIGAKRNYEMLRSYIDFVSAPVRFLYENAATAINKIINLINKIPGINIKGNLDEKLGDKAAEYISKLGFDPEKTKAEGDKTVKESKDALNKLLNDRAGYQLSANAIDNKGIESKKKNAEDEKKLQDDKLQGMLDELDAMDEFDQRVIDNDAKKKEQLKQQEDEAFAEMEAQFDAEKAARDKKAADDIEREKIVADAKLEIQMQALDAAGSLIGLVKSLGDESKDLQKAALIAESAVGIAKIIINTNQANAQALANPANEVTFGAYAAAKIPLNWATAGISIASTVAATAKGLSSLGGGSSPGGGGGATSAPSAQSAPSFNVVGNSGTNQLAQVMNKQGMPPVQAYVVASNVTSAQSLNRNIVNNATLG